TAEPDGASSRCSRTESTARWPCCEGRWHPQPGPAVHGPLHAALGDTEVDGDECQTQHRQQDSWRATVKKIILQVLLGISALLMFFRFGGPALIFGATGPGPFGNAWLADGKTATLLLDADLRFFGAMMLGLGVIFLWTIARVKALG